MNTFVNGSQATDTRGATVTSTSELSCGDLIEASYKGTPVHRGHVTDIAPVSELFWIMDHLTGGRRLLDIVEFHIVRIDSH